MLHRRLPAAAVTLIAVLALVGCEPPPQVVRSPDSTWEAVTLTDDTTDAGTDTYLLAGDAEVTTVTASLANHGGNTRIGFVARTDPTVDHGACVTVAGSTNDFRQEGVLVRWTGTRGVTVTKGVWAGVNTVANVHTWDLTAPADQRFTQIAQFPLTGLGWPKATAVPLPWRICASVSGPTLTFKVWPLAMAEPADGDPCCTGTVTVPWVEAGRAGWYAGHLQPGHTLVYRDLATTVTG